MNNEVSYRENAVKIKKRAKVLYDDIIDLMKNEHILEARYYLDKLLELKPPSEKNIALGYKIAIRMFDLPKVEYFDKKISEINANEELVMSLRLEFYCSVRSYREMELCTEWFLNRKNIPREYIQILIEVTCIFEKYEFISTLVKYMAKQKLKADKPLEKTFKEICLKKLVQMLHKVPHDRV